MTANHDHAGRCLPFLFDMPSLQDLTALILWSAAFSLNLIKCTAEVSQTSGWLHLLSRYLSMI